jgi:hypothetical protein
MARTDNGLEVLMKLRDLAQDHWVCFFDRFSRIHKGQLMNIDVHGAHVGVQPVAIRSPLLSIRPEISEGHVRAIEVRVHQHGEECCHAIHEPSRVRIGQYSNGCDELLIVDSVTEPTTVIDFRSAEMLSQPLRMSEAFEPIHAGS